MKFQNFSHLIAHYKKYYDELVRSGLGPKDSFWRLPTPAKYVDNDKENLNILFD